MHSLPRSTRRFHRSRSAFTLVEIVIVLTIISILGAGVMYMAMGWIDSSKDQRVSSDMESISVALMGYYSRANRFPTVEQGLAALVDKPTTEPVPERWTQLLKEVPVDPWNQPYKYVVPQQKSREGYDLWSVGPDGQDGTDDDVGNWKKPK